jgi:RHS repeat-associated protein
LINPRGYGTVHGYQAFDKPTENALTSIVQPYGITTTLSRDVFGKTISIFKGTSGGGITRSYFYDTYAQLCKTVEPETGATVFSYNAAGSVLWRASLPLPSPDGCDPGAAPNEKKISFGYDARNRLTSTVYGDGSAPISRTYTPDGQLFQVSTGGAKPTTWTMSYNKRRLRTQDILSYAGTNYGLTYTYDANGHQSQLHYPDGSHSEFAPNALGNPTFVLAHALGIAYHPNGGVASFTYGNGIQHVTSQNIRGLPQSLFEAGVIQDSYTYDANGNVTSITDTLAPSVTNRTMEYDDLDRLVKVTAPGVWGNATYSYDAVDNLVSSTLTGGATARTSTHVIDYAKNQLTSIISSLPMYTGAYSYDTQGNVMARGGQTYVFDLGNRFLSAPGRADYYYDGFGHRFLTVLPDGTNQLSVYSPAGKLYFWSQYGSSRGAFTSKYAYLGNRLIAEVSSANGMLHTHTDSLGSPIIQSNMNRQGIDNRTRYEPYGNVAGGGVPMMGYTGHWNEADLALIYMQQRYYDPLAGRFLSIDPVTTDANTGSSFNRYAYANNSPYNYIDPDGRAVESVTMDKNKNVHIVVGMSYKGAVTPKQADAFNKAIVNAYSGKKGDYAVTMTIIPSEQAKLGNYVTVVDGTKQSTTSGIGARETTLYTNDPAGATAEQVMSHEFGHLAGAGDRYTTQGPTAGYENNIMGSAKSGKVDERTIKEILERNPPSEPKKE